MGSRGQAFAFAVLFECGLGFLGVLLAWWAGISLREQFDFSQTAWSRGLLATAPMVVLLVLLSQINWKPLVQIRQHVEQLVRELFADSNLLEVALISIAAGLGEELLFRGALQPWVASWTHPWLAIVLVSSLFGLAHAVTTAYYFLATLMGVYFGWLAMAYNDLLAPTVAHALYDFVAILYFQRSVKGPKY